MNPMAIETENLTKRFGNHAVVDDLVGPVVYRRGIRDLAGTFLAPYRTELLEVAKESPELTTGAVIAPSLNLRSKLEAPLSSS